jgi:hypothetical protein
MFMIILTTIRLEILIQDVREEVPHPFTAISMMKNKTKMACDKTASDTYFPSKMPVKLEMQ